MKVKKKKSLIISLVVLLGFFGVGYKLLTTPEYSQKIYTTLDLEVEGKNHKEAQTLNIPEKFLDINWKESQDTSNYLTFEGKKYGGTVPLPGVTLTGTTDVQNGLDKPVEDYLIPLLEKQGWKRRVLYDHGYSMGITRVSGGPYFNPREEFIYMGHKDNQMRLVWIFSSPETTTDPGTYEGDSAVYEQMFAQDVKKINYKIFISDILNIDTIREEEKRIS